MQGYFNEAQTAQLLKALNPKRVGKDGKGHSHLQAWDVRAHANRIFGFARWDGKALSNDVIFEDTVEKNGRTGYTVAYKAHVEIVVKAPDGTELATYSAFAVGDSQNNPSRADAHDMAVKTAQSQAVKLCFVNLGTQFGLSLYQAGSMNDVVGRTLVAPEANAASVTPIDSHVTEQVAPEEWVPPAPEADLRVVSTPPVKDNAPKRVSKDELQARINAIQSGRK